MCVCVDDVCLCVCLCMFNCTPLILVFVSQVKAGQVCVCVCVAVKYEVIKSVCMLKRASIYSYIHACVSCFCVSVCSCV